MLDYVIRLGKRAGEYLKEHHHDEIIIEHKGRIDLVTSIDRQIQCMIVSEIERAFPDHAILAEEGFRKKGNSPFTWVIDPLDGTNNFIHGIPFFCVSIAVLNDHEPYIGVCSNPLRRELFWAQKGRGSYRNGSRLHVSRTERMIDSLIATGFPYDDDDIDRLMERFSCILRKARGIRRLGSAALDMCYVAAGSFDAFWEEGLKPWDMAAGEVIIREAGGMVTGLDGGPFDLYRGGIIASNAKLHEELRRCMDHDND